MERLNQPTSMKAHGNRPQENMLPRVPPLKHYLQANASYSKLSGIGSHNGLPRGFEGNHPSKFGGVPQVPLIKWKCPPRFGGIRSNWQVASGELSSEIEVQKQRELKVPEARYSRLSAIPPNPDSSVDNVNHNDQNAPQVPITPIEETNVVGSGSANKNVKDASTSKSNDTLSFYKGATPDIVEAAQDAVSTIMQVAVSNLMSILDSRTPADKNVLVNILKDPKIVKQLLTTPSPTTQKEPFTSFHGMTPSMHNVQSSSFLSRPATGMTNAAQNNMPSTSFCPPSTVRPSIANEAKATPRLMELISSVEFLRSIGIHHENDFLIQNFLQTLPAKSYSSFIENLNMSKTKLTLPELLNKLETFEEAKTEDKHVLTAGPSAGPDLKGEKHREKMKNKPQEKKKNKNKSVSNDIPMNHNSVNIKKDGKCFRCKQPGHFRKDCTAELPVKAQGTPGTSGEGMPS